tara:strand:- start:1526 stop:1729 length:204 start_codon:yes stop_codon:yes gene_type:complete
MALSQQVSDSLDEAKANLRNALAWAARTEEPYISKHIADILLSIDTIKETHKYVSDLRDMMGERDDK